MIVSKLDSNLIISVMYFLRAMKVFVFFMILWTSAATFPLSDEKGAKQQAEVKHCLSGLVMYQPLP